MYIDLNINAHIHVLLARAGMINTATKEPQTYVKLVPS